MDGATTFERSKGPCVSTSESWSWDARLSLLAQVSILGLPGVPIESGWGISSALGKAERRKHSVLMEGKALIGVLVAGCVGSRTPGPILCMKRSFGEPGPGLQN